MLEIALQVREEKIKGIWIGMEEVKLSLFIHDAVVYIKEDKDHIRKFL